MHVKTSKARFRELPSSKGFDTKYPAYAALNQSLIDYTTSCLHLFSKMFLDGKFQATVVTKNFNTTAEIAYQKEGHRTAPDQKKCPPVIFPKLFLAY